MRWPFGKESRRDAAVTKQLVELTQAVQHMGEEITNAVSKLQRFYFKGQRDLLEAMHAAGEKASETAEKVEQWRQESSTYDEERLRVALIDVVDQMDRVVEAPDGGLDPTWRQVVEDWRAHLMTLLEELGLSEATVLGHQFDPGMADAVDTVSLTSPDARRFSHTEPYLVVRVVRRGFVDESGRVYRKARVVTVRADAEEQSHP